jgi:VanZ family protein
MRIEGGSLARAGAGLTILAALLALAAPRGARADPLFLSGSEQGGWTAPDKQLHFAASFAVAASLSVKGWDEGESVGATVGIGLLKEAYDATLKPSKPRGASLRDLAADVLGAVLGVLLVSAMDGAATRPPAAAPR